jgi:hypothetical protein
VTLSKPGWIFNALNNIQLALDYQIKVLQSRANDLRDFAKTHKAQLQQERLRPNHGIKEVIVKKPSKTEGTTVHRIRQFFARPL